MARTRFVPGLRVGEGFSILIHGFPNVGKTHLMGDMLRTEAARGPVCYLNTVGEDGDAATGGMFQDEIGENLETMKDLREWIAETRKKPIQALGLDSVRLLMNFALYEIVGEVRMPDAKKDGERSKAMWGQLRFNLETIFLSLKQTARYVFCTCPSDKEGADVGGMVTPDLFGKLARGSAYWFDFVGALTATVIGTGKVERKLKLAPSLNYITKQRLATPIIDDIVIPVGGGGWASLKTQIEKGSSALRCYKDTSDNHTQKGGHRGSTDKYD